MGYVVKTLAMHMTFWVSVKKKKKVMEWGKLGLGQTSCTSIRKQNAPLPSWKEGSLEVASAMTCKVGVFAFCI